MVRIKGFGIRLLPRRICHLVSICILMLASNFLISIYVSNPAHATNGQGLAVSKAKKPSKPLLVEFVYPQAVVLDKNLIKTKPIPFAKAKKWIEKAHKSGKIRALVCRTSEQTCYPVKAAPRTKFVKAF